jgi:hypothetical protein
MKNHIAVAFKTFTDGCDRADGLKAIYDYLAKRAPAALNCDDILRSALVLAVSSFDLLLHDILRLEVIYRLSVKKEVGSLRIPFNILISDERLQLEIIDQCIRKDNSYKSFVAPDKFADCLRTLIENPWGKIAINSDESVAAIKIQLKNVVDLRNRIAHEADVNPAYGGVELWPIYRDDVSTSIVFLRKLGKSVAASINDA